MDDEIQWCSKATGLGDILDQGRHFTRHIQPGHALTQFFQVPSQGIHLQVRLGLKAIEPGQGLDYVPTDKTRGPSDQDVTTVQGLPRQRGGEHTAQIPRKNGIRRLHKCCPDR